MLVHDIHAYIYQHAQSTALDNLQVRGLKIIQRIRIAVYHSRRQKPRHVDDPCGIVWRGLYQGRTRDD